jgi:hypothetical protein
LRASVKPDMNAIETTGVVDAQHRLRQDEPLLIPSVSPAFDFLNEAAEDVYTDADGKLFHDQR